MDYLKPQFNQSTSPKELLEQLKQVIVNLMGEDWFKQRHSKISTHPAHKNIELLNKFIGQGGVFKWPEDEPYLPQFCSFSLDAISLVTASGSPQLEALELGDFSAFGDYKAQNRIQDVLDNPVSYSSQFTEISFAGWCLDQKLEVKPFEDTSVADFLVDDLTTRENTIVECKKILRGTSLNRIGQDIKHANKQIKALNKLIDSNHAGIVLLDISDAIIVHGEISESIPDSVNTYIDLASKAVSNHNSSVSGVLIVWQDFSITPRPQDLNVILRRRSHLIRHKRPKVELSGGNCISQLGNSVTFQIVLSTCPLDFKF